MVARARGCIGARDLYKRHIADAPSRTRGQHLDARYVGGADQKSRRAVRLLPGPGPKTPPCATGDDGLGLDRVAKRLPLKALRGVADAWALGAQHSLDYARDKATPLRGGY